MRDIPLKPKESMFTDEQWEAIHLSGNNLLLAASAGSGKTRVLVERVLAQLKGGRDIDQLLIVTFTRAAAKEMKDRLRDNIQEEINTSSDRSVKNQMIKQISLLNEAQISTIHSFCNEVIKNFYYLIDLDPVFSLMNDETEIEMVKEVIWSSLREEYFNSKRREDFIQLSKLYASDRTEEGLTDLIYRLYDLSQAQLNPSDWLDQLDQLYQVDHQNFYQSSLWKTLLKDQLVDILTSLSLFLSQALDILASDEELSKQREVLEFEHTSYQSILDAVREDNFSRARSLALSLEFKRWPSSTKLEDDQKERANQAKYYRTEAKKSFNTELLERYFTFALDQALVKTEEMQKPIQTLIAVVKDFSRAYQEYKLKQKILDFNDLEHYCYQILIAKNEEGEAEAALYYQERFEELLIDEYQDTNLLQEEILKTISKPDSEGNRFMVGDVKQSIYRFRMAEPDLFMQKYKDYGKKASMQGERIILQDNFRSRKEVLDFVNLIFQQLMDESIGDLVYDQEAELMAGFSDFPESDDFQAEILLYCEEEQEKKDSFNQDPVDYHFSSKRKGEIMLAGQKIKSLVESGFMIYDKKIKKNRPVTYGDIVILSRNKRSNFDIQMILQDLGIPSSIPNIENYFQSLEVGVMLAVLRLIDNPRQDIALATVLRSPILGLDENDLADIRIHDKSKNYYAAYQSFLQSNLSESLNPDLYRKLSAFDKKLSSWQSVAARMRISELIWKIYEDTGFLDYVGGMPGGRQRKSNLHALYEIAINFEENNQLGLYAFIRYIEKMLKKDRDLNEPHALSEEDAVRVMTIHNSKGLEFPIVFVINLSSKINDEDFNQDVMVDKDFGLASKYIDADRRIKAPSLQSVALSYELKRRSYSEEMRVLYVAMTRAEQKLILIGNTESKEKAIEEWETMAGHTETILPTYARLNSTNMMKWLGMSIIRHSSLSDETQLKISNNLVRHHPASFSLSFYSKEQILEKLGPHLFNNNKERDWFDHLDLDSLGDRSSSVQGLIQLMEADYSYPLAVQTTSYQSVSEIKRVFEDPHQKNLLQLDQSYPLGKNRYVIDEMERPTFVLEDSHPNPAEIGMGVHLLLQSLDFSDLPSRKDLEESLKALVDSKKIKESVAQEINLNKLLDFLDTDFAQRMVDNAASLRREVSFSLKLPAERIFSDINQGEDILIHGITDGYFIEGGDLVLFDYKTDRLERYGDFAEEAMLEKYQGQLNLYQLALENILEKRVKESYLILLDQTLIVQVNK